MLFIGISNNIVSLRNDPKLIIHYRFVWIDKIKEYFRIKGLLCRKHLGVIILFCSDINSINYRIKYQIKHIKYSYKYLVSIKWLNTNGIIILLTASIQFCIFFILFLFPKNDCFTHDWYFNASNSNWLLGVLQAIFSLPTVLQIRATRKCVIKILKVVHN